MTRLIDADRLLAALREFQADGSLRPTALATVGYAIDRELQRKRAADSWRNPGWEERRDEVSE
jgi:hypothetical protein